MRELLRDVSLRVTETDSTDAFRVAGRGEMHLSILIENMRREGYELGVSTPRVLFHEVDGKRYEPIEELSIDVPEDCVGSVMEKLGSRKAELQDMHPQQPYPSDIFDPVPRSVRLQERISDRHQGRGHHEQRIL